MDKRSYREGRETEHGEEKPTKAANESGPAPEGEKEEKNRLTMLHREAQAIAQNLKESGTRR
jgi:hypothetical protein